MSKVNYYDITNMLKTKAQYMMLLGQRANGKSYQAKKTCIEDFINNIVIHFKWKKILKKIMKFMKMTMRNQ